MNKVNFYNSLDNKNYFYEEILIRGNNIKKIKFKEDDYKNNNLKEILI